MNNSNSSKPDELSGSEIEQRAKQSVDQAVVDGLVDGQQQRVSRKFLLATGFNGVYANFDDKLYFEYSLEKDSRFIDLTRNPIEYGFLPELGDDSIVRAHKLSIVRGIARCSLVERADVLNRMNGLVELIIEKSKTDVGILSRKTIGSILYTNDQPVSHDEYGALIEYIAQDSRFQTLNDQLIITRESIADVTYSALQSLRPDIDGSFGLSRIIDCIKRGGLKIEKSQVRQIKRCLKLMPNVETINEHAFRFTDSQI